VQIKYAGLIKGLNNGLKNYEGKFEGIDRINLLEIKEGQEKDFLEWVKGKPVREELYGDVLEDISVFMEKYAAFERRNTLLGRMVSSSFGSALLSQAYTIFRTVEEKEKPDMERDSPRPIPSFVQLKRKKNRTWKENQLTRTGIFL